MVAFPEPERTFAPGTPLLHRNIAYGKARFVVPATVVADEPEETRLLYREGTPIMGPPSHKLRHDPAACEAAQRVETAAREWDMVDGVWEDTDVLVVARPGDWYSVWLLWAGADRTLTQYYVNFEVPWRRTATGFDTRDLGVDLVVGLDRQPRWKDVTAYAQRIADGFITAEQVEHVERAHAEVLARIERREGVFSGRYDDFTPDPAWPPATVTPGWDRVD